MKALLVLLLLATTAHARTVSYAVVIGNNSPPTDTELPKLRYADDDAVRYYQLLSQFSRTTLLSTLDDETQKRHAKVATLARIPTLENLRQVFAALRNDMRLDREGGNDPVLYFVFSGHGAIAASGEAYLALDDGPLTQKILFDELLGSLPTPRTHVIIDACHAGGLVGVRGGNFFDKESDGKTEKVKDADAIAISNDKLLERYPNVGVIIATTLGNETHEWSQIESGVFTYEVLSGLAGPADINGDQTIEYSELQAFVSNANRSISNPRAVPIMVSEPPRADRRAPVLKLADLRQSYLLRGNVGGWGHFSIELEGGQRLLDAHVSGERPIAVALPVGQTLYVRTPKGESRITSRTGGVATADLRFVPTTIASRGGIDADYRDNLFLSAYGPTYYRGYVDSHGGVPVDFTVNLELTAEIHTDAEGDLARRIRTHRRRGYGFGVTAGVFGAGALVAGWYVLRARHQFAESSARWRSAEFAEDYKYSTALFWTSTALSAAFAVATWGELAYAQHLQLRAAATIDGGALSLEGTM